MEPPAVENDNSQIYDMILHDKHAPVESPTTLTWRGGNSPSADWTLVVGSTTYQVHRCIVTEGPRMSFVFAQASDGYSATDRFVAHYNVVPAPPPSPPCLYPLLV